VVHVSTVGVTELILPNGKVTQQIPAFKPGYVLGRLPLTSELTPAMRFYGWVDALALSITGLLLAFAISLLGRQAIRKFRLRKA
jgi:apolipoprotein N-acyltransferase